MCSSLYINRVSMEFSRQEYWTRLPFPSTGDLPDPGIEPRSPTLQVDSTYTPSLLNPHIPQTTHLLPCLSPLLAQKPLKAKINLKRQFKIQWPYLHLYGTNINQLFADYFPGMWPLNPRIHQGILRCQPFRSRCHELLNIDSVLRYDGMDQKIIPGC